MAGILDQSMSAEIPEHTMRIARQHNLEVILHPQGSTATARMAADQLGVDLCRIANTLLWMCDSGTESRPLLLVIGGDRRVNPNTLKRTATTSVRMATVVEIADYLGSRPGSVCPFVNHNIPVLIESSLEQYSFIYPSAGTDCSSVKIGYHQLIDICHAESAPFAQ